jgi:hypothetical protein
MLEDNLIENVILLCDKLESEQIDSDLPGKAKEMEDIKV